MVGSLGDIVSYKRMYVDAMNLCARSYYGMRLLAHNGTPTGMLFGVARLVLDWYRKYPGIEISFLWEGSDSWRLKKYPIYKNSRQHVDRSVEEREQFNKALAVVMGALPSMGVIQREAATHEADDLVWALAQRLPDLATVYVSTDWDWWPLADFGVVLYKDALLTATDMLDSFEHKFGCRLQNIADLRMFKVLTGDPSDDISGIPRIPRKLAADIASSGAVTFGGVCEYLSSVGNTRWLETVIAHEWVFERNLELITPSRIEEPEICVTPASYSKGKFGDTLLKYGMESLYDRLEAL